MGSGADYSEDFAVLSGEVCCRKSAYGCRSKGGDHGAVRLIRAWKTGEDLHPISEDPTAGTMTAVLLCPHCNVISLIDLGNISAKQANERTQRCPACGREVKA